MNTHNGMNDSNNNNNKNKKTKPIAVLPMASALVGAVILLSGLSLIGNGGYHSTIAQQQNTTEGSSGNATTTGGGAGANQSTSELRMNLEQARTALQNNDTQSAMMYLEMALSTVSGGGTEGNITSSTTAGGGNATTTTGGDEAVSIGGTGVGDDYDETADD
jgi:hypothetical protein